MRSSGGLDDLVDVSMQSVIWQRRDSIDVVDIRPDLRVQFARISWVTPVRYDAGAAEVDQE